MTRLRTAPPRLAAIAPRLGRAPGDEPARDRERDATQPWRAWYRSSRWRRLRLRVFERDGYVCRRSGQLCTGRGNEPLAPVANHKRPHHGDPQLFWDEDNVETVTKAVHDSEVQAAERAEAGGWV